MIQATRARARRLRREAGGVDEMCIVNMVGDTQREDIN